MKAKKNTGSMIAGLLFGLAMTGLIFQCGQQTTETVENHLVIVYASGEALVEKAGEEIPARVGLKVESNDVIRTQSGTIDLQSRTGSAIRVREMTTITVAALTGSDTDLDVDHGGILANVRRGSSSENFNVTTPTAIAGVRGTVFSVEVDPFSDSSSVRVLEGSVAMNPRVERLENTTEEEISADPELQKLVAIRDREVIIEQNHEGRFSTNDLERVAASEEEESAITVEGFEPANEDIIEMESLVAIDNELLDQLAADDEAAVASASETIERQRQERQNSVFSRIEEEASEREFGDEEEIREFYQTLERIIMRDGTQLSGAVIAQTGDVLVVHTSEGVVRVNRSEIQSQEFQ